ncbi:SpoIVB peptidase S55 domain-containing protein [Nocardioides sp. CER19]|uniref:SpoIVB peptidase S55 domain-containing protein n=1 Tax=Nocardioides sp. CER19 TaxID=3038538 RepID=UPI002446CF2D|nr:SpoIVB peptidase S55 domain-containing protein [Nocardioides sp. CER19]MDH2416421.1 SpoIVB peptidase S55 domain-containing protein [Nocardioides sp. CER19]
MSLRVRRPLAALLGAVSLAGAAVSLPVSPARSVPPAADAECPDVAPLDGIAAGQPVDGLTVSSGTTPETFTGSVLGTITDGIGPGLDMIVVRLTSPEIDRVGGIWEGMSGSPVYAADGRLIGAVSYGLAYGSSPVAGVTPAVDMKALLTSSPASAAPQARPAQRVGLPARLRASAVDGGATTAREAGSGLERLTVPVAVSGLSSARLKRASSRLGLDNVRLYRSGPAAAAPAAGGDPQIVAGGNLAASLSYGDFSAVATGTTTMVCDGVVVGFGHPFGFAGDTSLTMHGADAIDIQEDPLGAPFKVSNPTGPVGVVDEDRLAGIKGELGAGPATTLIHTVVTGTRGASRTGDTRVSVPEFASTATQLGLLANLDRVFDHTGKGSAYVRFTISGRTAAGARFTLTRANRFVDSADVTNAASGEPAAAVDALVNNDVTGVTLDRVSVDAALSDQVRSYRIAKAQVRVRGVWRTAGPRSVLRVRHGRRILLRVFLRSRRDELGTKVITTSLRVPAAAPHGVMGVVDIGSSASGDVGADGSEEVGTVGGDEGPSSLGQLIRDLQTAPRNDELDLTLQLESDDTSPSVSVRQQVGSVVTGDRQFMVRVR